MLDLFGVLSLPDALNGALSGEGTLSGVIDQTFELTGSLILPVRSSEEYYEGSYDIFTSTEEDQILPTRRKILDADIIVRKIDYTETTNPSGGYTAYIAQGV